MLKQLSTTVICLAASSSMAFAQVATTGQTAGTGLLSSSTVAWVSISEPASINRIFGFRTVGESEAIRIVL